MHRPFGAQLREARRARGLSLRQVEAATGIRDVVIGSWEREDRSPAVRSPELDKLLEFYELSLELVPRLVRSGAT